jgi:WNK lysine deficient protein kinase
MEGVAYLHSQNFVHGKLTCESIYINSNNGDIKIGDLGIRTIPCYNNSKRDVSIRIVEYSELSMSHQLKMSEETTKLDIYCFGLSLLEMISSDVSGTQAFKVLCKIINKGEKQ